MTGPVGASIPHDSARLHVSGEALYIDDLPEPRGLLHAAMGLSSEAHARILSLDLTAVRAAPGVLTVITAEDVPGINDIGPIFPGDPIFAERITTYHGQVLFAVAARTRAEARAATALARVTYDPLPPVLTLDEALAREDARVAPSRLMKRGEPEAAIARSPQRLRGTLYVGGQDHFYLEGQIAVAHPGEQGDMLIQSSTQNPSELQHLVAHALHVPDHSVTCETRRMGGGFGGKESQAAIPAAIAALLAAKTGRAVKCRMDRDDDMIITGKRHPFRIDYDVGFDDQGVIGGIHFMLAGDCGHSADLSTGVNDRAMMHADNCYFLENVSILSHRCRTNTTSHTAFRGFGGPQGIMAIEHVLDEIARHVKRDPLIIRQRNFYGSTTRNVTPYGMVVEDNIIAELVDQLVRTSDYLARRTAIAAFNMDSRWIKRGIALVPVKFGISFTAIHLNQAGALIQLYTDGSVLLNHGGTEMGQGLFIKVAQVVAEEFGITVDRVRVTATSTAKVPNTSPTAASAGTDLNAKAAQAAAHAIKQRLAHVAAEAFGVPATAVIFANGEVIAGRHRLPFAEITKLARMQRVSLSATGFYATPKIHFDAETQTGRPFYYFAYGAAVAEVEVDGLTGEYRQRRVDILHDCGKSLNPAIDLGQIEGGFVQGAGWLTSEELFWDAKGRLRTHAPSTYKIPAIGDLAPVFRARIYEAGRNRENAIFRSKAVGEPPLNLGISVFHAIKDAVAAFGDAGLSPHLDAPATPERVLLAIEHLRAAGRAAPIDAKAAE
ncbi:xanthine dehydrogenase molybdopterin binding subunit [Acidisoma silvae]|uniref:Xanthine dehydrogenase molybdopterin binding subunit n=1 Tax=Acidisoma silvae TaxID=2802396 RepID=A0A963YN17_9PROT|nr:xanthine dehydrogenase molybdopterin binding subunit [Acidisoma silvae]MCB8873883.1 xanthine dehydrogenase molybdopterin binding subunit [Acidisoma silvae]